MDASRGHAPNTSAARLMGAAPKLTKPQREELESLAGAFRVAERRQDTGYFLGFMTGPERVVARNLARMGLIAWSEKTCLGAITPAGLAALSVAPKASPRQLAQQPRDEPK